MVPFLPKEGGGVLIQGLREYCLGRLWHTELSTQALPRMNIFLLYTCSPKKLQEGQDSIDIDKEMEEVSKRLRERAGLGLTTSGGTLSFDLVYS